MIQNNIRLRTSILFLIVFLGAWFRFQGLDWDRNQHLQPDERYISMVLSSLSLPKSIGEYLDPNTSSISPYLHNFGSYIYGQFPLTVTTYLSTWLGMNSYASSYLLGRALSALLDTCSIILTFKLGKILWNKRVGTIGAAFFAFSPLAIQYAHFMVMESWVVFSWLMVFLLVLQKTKKMFAKVFMIGIALGISLAIKASSIFLVPLIVVLLLGRSFKETPSRSLLEKLVIQCAVYCLLLTIVSALSFRFFQPTIFSSAS